MRKRNDKRIGRDKATATQLHTDDESSSLPAGNTNKRQERLITWLWRYRWRVATGLIALTLLNGVSLVVPLVMREAIDLLARGERGYIRSALQITGLALATMGLRFLWRYFLIGTSRRIEQALRSKFYTHLLRMDASFYNRTKTGDLMAHATNDIDAVTRACGFGILTLVDPIILVPLALIIMTSIAPQLTLYAIIPFPFLFLLLFGFGKIIHHRFQAVQQTFSHVMENVRENVAGIRVVKAFAQEEGTNRDFNLINTDLVNKNMHLVKIWGLFQPLISLLGGISLAIVLFFGGRSVIGGDLSLGDFVAIGQYIMMLSWPIVALGWSVDLIQRGRASLQRINAILNTEPEIKAPRHPKPFSSVQIEFRNLSFSYNNGKSVDTLNNSQQRSFRRNQNGRELALQNIDLTIEEGITLGIIGPTGAGKSTLIRLIPRIWDPPSKTLFIGGTDVHELSLEEIRRQISVVPQDPFLFSTTIAENIRFGRPEATMEEIERATQLTGIYDEIRAFSQGFDTLVGERGISLSGGQKQRLAIARAIILDPRILIMDDSLSAVDAEREEMILDNLQAIFAAKTSIVIAHRVSTVANSDKIIVLDRGRIVESGNHNALVQREGIYSNLYRLQQIEG
ncbi:ABC transporter ATP-binding protein/permease [Candidatus Acetothermia bacterium]|nr:ABC transporter ATP-binding protein/permease [Candidatus Acetothermia bacterium]MCI2427481.1 ABC transporter ATP-binding protein/permease [Candidatus Acetothermia bacterium]